MNTAQACSGVPATSSLSGLVARTNQRRLGQVKVRNPCARRGSHPPDGEFKSHSHPATPFSCHAFGSRCLDRVMLLPANRRARLLLV